MLSLDVTRAEDVKCIYVKENPRVTPINTTIDKPEGLEDLWVTMQCRKLLAFIICCLY